MSETSLRLLWLIPLMPAVGALVLGVAGRRMPKRLVAALACGTLAVSFVVSLLSAHAVLGGHLDDAMSGGSLRVDAAARVVELDAWDWLSVGSSRGQGPGEAGPAFLTKLSVPFGFWLDPLSAVMILVVTGVGFLIHVYAAGYMWEEAGYARFFTYLNLFVAMMLTLVMGSSFLLMFVGWEGVGLCSYLLIGYYHEGEVPPAAGLKAFLVNRVGDFGFVLGLLLMWVSFGSLSYGEVFPRIAGASGFAGTGLAFAMAGLLFVGCTGKSAQFPLHVWLPDAMAGPTPVSALIHAATMVTAGVYMVIRANVLFQAAPAMSAVVCVVGALTALMAASIALVQNDIKRILAYSTVSQLGYMFIAAGAGAYSAALFHLVTHAFFKALLFLGAGSVSHALSGELDARKMGGLRTKLPHTHQVMLVATIAIAGIPPLAGFWSKDEILHGVFTSALPEAVRYGVWIAALLGAALTAFYMFRMYFLVFGGSARWGAGVHPHESPWSMLGPLYVLALLSLVGGALGLPAWTGLDNHLHHVLGPVIFAAGALVAGAHHVTHGLELALVAAATAMGVIGLLVAWSWYRGESAAPARLAASWPRLHRLLMGKWRVDEAQEALLIHPVVRLAEMSAGFDKSVVDGRLVEAPGLFAATAGEILRGLSSGKVRTYALAMLGGAACLLVWLVAR